MESISLEYSYLLEAQRQYFDEQLRRIESQKTRKINQLEEEFAELLEYKEQSERKVRKCEEEKKKLEKKLAMLENKLQEVDKETDFLRQVCIVENPWLIAFQINQALKENQDQWQKKLKEVENKLTESCKLKDQKIQELEVG